LSPTTIAYCRPCVRFACALSASGAQMVVGGRVPIPVSVYQSLNWRASSRLTGQNPCAIISAQRNTWALTETSRPSTAFRELPAVERQQPVWTKSPPEPPAERAKRQLLVQVCQAGSSRYRARGCPSIGSPRQSGEERWHHVETPLRPFRRGRFCLAFSGGNKCLTST
jgi:hypothetical protein